MKQTLLLLVVILSFSSYSQIEYSKVLHNSPISVESHAVVNSDDNGIVIAGMYNNEGAAFSIDQNGDPLWVKTFGDWFDFQDILATKDSALLIVGMGSNDSILKITAALIKINTFGDTLWTTNLSINNNNYGYKAFAVETYDSSYVIAWTDMNSTIGIAKLGQNGNMIWSKVLELPNTSFSVNCVKELSDSTIIITGIRQEFDNNGYLLNIDSNGQILWSKDLENGYLDDIAVADSGFYAVGRFETFSNSYRKYSKFNNAGVNLWHNEIVGAGPAMFSEEELSEIKWVSDTSLLLAIEGESENFSYLIYDDGSITGLFFYDMRGQDVLVKNNGDVLFVGNGPVYGIKGSTYLSPNIAIIQTGPNLDIPSCGFYINTYPDSIATFPDSPITFNEIGTPFEYPSNITMGVGSIIDTNMCVEYIGGIDEINSELPVTVYPNSSTGIFNFEVNSTEEISITIIDSKGRTISIHSSIQAFTTINLSSESDGFYYYKAVDGSGRQAHGKLILMK